MAAQQGRDLLNAARSLRSIEDPEQRRAVLSIMGPELVNRFGIPENEVMNGLDNNELDAVISSLERFSPSPAGAKVGRFRTFTDESGTTFPPPIVTGKHAPN